MINKYDLLSVGGELTTVTSGLDFSIENLHNKINAAIKECADDIINLHTQFPDAGLDDKEVQDAIFMKALQPTDTILWEAIRAPFSDINQRITELYTRQLNENLRLDK